MRGTAANQAGRGARSKGAIVEGITGAREHNRAERGTGTTVRGRGMMAGRDTIVRAQEHKFWM